VFVRKTNRRIKGYGSESWEVKVRKKFEKGHGATEEEGNERSRFNRGKGVDSSGPDKGDFSPQTPKKLTRAYKRGFDKSTNLQGEVLVRDFPIREKTRNS